MAGRTNRREFIKKVSVLGAGAIIGNPFSVFGAGEDPKKPDFLTTYLKKKTLGSSEIVEANEVLYPQGYISFRDLYRDKIRFEFFDALETVHFVDPGSVLDSLVERVSIDELFPINALDEDSIPLIKERLLKLEAAFRVELGLYEKRGDKHHEENFKRVASSHLDLQLLLFYLKNAPQNEGGKDEAEIRFYDTELVIDDGLRKACEEYVRESFKSARSAYLLAREPMSFTEMEDILQAEKEFYFFKFADQALKAEKTPIYNEVIRYAASKHRIPLGINQTAFQHCLDRHYEWLSDKQKRGELMRQVGVLPDYPEDIGLRDIVFLRKVFGMAAEKAEDYDPLLIPVIICGCALIIGNEMEAALRKYVAEVSEHTSKDALWCDESLRSGRLRFERAREGYLANTYIQTINEAIETGDPDVHEIVVRDLMWEHCLSVSQPKFPAESIQLPRLSKRLDQAKEVITQRFEAGKSMIGEVYEIDRHVTEINFLKYVMDNL